MFQEPPPAALEFLVKIREVIAIAKHKMEAKRFQPILNEIPEEETYSSNGNSLDVYQGMGSQRSGSVISLKRENSRKKNCLGCPGCTTIDEDGVHHAMKYSVPPCTNCLGTKGDKQSSIRKWLENIPAVKNSYNDSHPNSTNSLVSIQEQQHRIRKQNSFTSPCTMFMNNEYLKPKKSSSMSVRSEPTRRAHSYNLPLPEFDNADYHQSLNQYYAQTIAQATDINPVGLNYRSDSLRNKAINQLRKKNDLPDMVNEAIALDHSTKSYNQSSSDEERFGVNYNTKNVNPYTRKSSESPIANDYETDSLERNSNKKELSCTSAEYPDIPSSQASPSLSTALPLEEELTMRNAVYNTHSSSNSNTPSPHRDTKIRNDYETTGKSNNSDPDRTLTRQKSPNVKGDYSLVSEVYVNNNYNFGSTPTSPSGSECSLGSRKLIVPTADVEEKPGCLTIEVKDSPENYIKVHESDDFEPDTLDRKHSKHKITGTLDRKPPKHRLAMESEFGTSVFDSNNIDQRPSQRIQLRSSGTFKKPALEQSSKFHSLRSEYEQRHIFDRPKLSSELFSGSKSHEDTVDDMWEETPPEWVTEEGRILTLEHRHSKRQRQSTPPTIKQMKILARPDILPPLPPSEDPIYEHPAFPPRQVENERVLETHSKNLNGRSLSPRTFTIANEFSTSDNSLPADSSCSPCSPMRASVQSQSSEYENTDPKAQWKGESFRTFEQPARCTVSSINTDTFVKNNKTESKRFRRKKSNIQDSGYLSSDSGSRQMPRKLVVAKIVSCSESDDTENEARSESGAESVETHSVYYDNFRNTNENCAYRYNNNSRSSRDSGRNKRTDL